MDTLMAIRALIFFVAGLVVILFPKNVMKTQTYLLRKMNIKYSESKKSLIVLGAVFIIISAVLLVIAIIR